MNSMTGFGRAGIKKKEYKMDVELAAVNSRFLEPIFRMPRVMAQFENQARDLIGKHLNRGKITVTVNLEESPEAFASSLLNQKAAVAYYHQLVELKKKLKLPGEIEIGHVLAHPDLLSSHDEGLDQSRLWGDFEKILLQALKELQDMRNAEGRHLQKEMTTRLKKVDGLVTRLEKRSPVTVAAYKARLVKRIKDLGEGVDVNESRLAEEVTVFADRADVTEECTRLRSHISQFLATLKQDGDAGKRLNFILQEMSREANTISSKSVSTDTSTYAIELKEEVEKLREQAQNIE
jgi:uncharacterized protein (TIGR00255 family)